MNKTLCLALLTAAGLSFAAATAPGDNQVDTQTKNQILYISWSGTGTGAWQEFEIYYDPQTRTFEGKWFYEGEHRGWIQGRAVEDIGNFGVIGEGTFGGDYSGKWKGTFYFRGECFGETHAHSEPPGDGRFHGI